MKSFTLSLFFILIVALNTHAQSIQDALLPDPAGNVILYFTHPDGSLITDHASIAAFQMQTLHLLTGTGFQIRHRYQELPALALSVSPQALAQLRETPGIGIQPDRIVTTMLLNNNQVVRATPVHDLGITGDTVRVAVLDTGIDTDHPSLTDDLVAQACFASDCGRKGGPNAEDGNGHGTHVSGIITSSDPQAPGIAPNAEIVAVKVLSNYGSGSMSDIIAGLEWVLANQAAYNIRIINMSLGAWFYSGYCDQDEPVTAAVMQRLRAANIAVFVASGNSSMPSAWSSPACIESAIAVGATFNADYDQSRNCPNQAIRRDDVTCFSNATAMLDLLAPGAEVNSTWFGGGLRVASGTSMAAPSAAAVAALILSAYPDLTVDELEYVMRSGGEALLDVRNGMYFPRVDAFGAVMALAHETIPPFNDDLATPTPLAAGFVERLPMDDATHGADEPMPSCVNEVGKSVWYRYAPTQDGMMILDLRGSSVEVMMAVYAEGASGLVEVICQPMGTLQPMRLTIAPNTRYVFMVGALADAHGELTVRFSLSE